MPYHPSISYANYNKRQLDISNYYASAVEGLFCIPFYRGICKTIKKPHSERRQQDSDLEIEKQYTIFLTKTVRRCLLTSSYYVY